jgi:flagellar biogenesis protein FliO
MFPRRCFILTLLLALAAARLASGQGSAAPIFPDWQVGSSVYSAAGAPPATAEASTALGPTAAPLVAPQSAAPRPDRAVELAGATIPLTSEPAPAMADSGTDSRRQLRPRESTEGRPAVAEPASAASSALPRLGMRFDSLYTSLSALTIVLGLFFLLMWLVRRSARQRTTILPRDVVTVLGRVPLAAKQFAELLRVGNKLVLVCLTAEGAKPLTEVTDPAEVDRLLGLCQQLDPHSTTRAFEQVFRELARDRADGFLGEEASAVSEVDAYGRLRGGASHG